MTQAAGQPASNLPAYVVRGDDPSLVSQAARDLISHLVGEGDRYMAVEEFIDLDGGVTAVIDACCTLPFLVERRVVVVRDCGRLGTEDVSRLCAYLDDPSPTTSLVMIAGGGPLPARLSTATKKVGHIVDATVGTGQAASKWLSDRLRSAPIKLDGRATELVGKHLGLERGRLEGLLGALAVHFGEGARLGVDDVSAFLGEAGDVVPWELTDAIDRSDVSGALAMARRMMSGGKRHPLAILALLSRHYVNLLRLDGAEVTSDADAAELLGTKSTFVAGKALKQSSALGHDPIARAIHLLAGADLDLRGLTGHSGEAVIEVLVARLANLAPRPRPRARPKARA
ncbi:MAG: DNA polymerase III subunit delta [Acidimicrobiales bacterium]